MATPYLGARLTTGPRLQRFVNATPSDLGSATGGTAVTYGITNAPYSNNAARFGGLLYFFSGDAIRRSRDDGQTYETVYSLSPAASVTLGCVVFGPFVIYKDGVPRLVCVYEDNVSVIRYVWSSSGNSGSWTNASSGFSSSSGGLARPSVFRSTIVIHNRFQLASNGNILQIDPFLGTASQAGLSGLWSTTQFYYPVVWNDVFYIVGAGTTGTNGLKLASLAGGVLTSVLTIESSVNYTLDTIVAFVDPSTDNLIIIGRSGTGAAYKAWEVTPALSITERTSTMITGSSLAAFGATSKASGVIFDQDATPGADPDIYVVYCSANTAGTAMNMFKYNGPTTLIGVAGVPDDTGGDIILSIADGNIGGERFFTPRSPGVDGVPEIHNSGRGSPIVAATRRKFKTYYPRSEILTTIGGSPATHDLSTTPITNTPVQPGSVTIRGVISATTEIAQDDGAGAFPISTLLPAGGTINYASGAFTGTTASLDATTDVEALYNGGTTDVSMYRDPATTEYPASVAKAGLSNPTHGSISGGVDNVGVPADGTECQVNVAMAGFLAGDRFSLQPFVT